MSATVVVSGIALGTIYALVGLAVTVVARVARTLHLAVGAVVVLGVVVQGYLEALGVPLAVGLALTVALGAGASVLLDLTVVAPFARRGPVLPLIGLAVATVVIEAAAARLLTTRSVRPDPLLAVLEADRGFGVAVPAGLVTALVLGAPLAAVLALALARTRWGARLRLVGAAPAAAELGGISPGRTRAVAFAVSGAVAVVAGALLAPITALGVGQGAALTVRGVAAAVVLGFAGPTGTVVAGLVLGAIEAAAQGWLPGVGSSATVGAAVVALVALRGGARRRAWGRAW